MNTSWINEEKGSEINKRKVYEKLVSPTIPPEIELYSQCKRFILFWLKTCSLNHVRDYVGFLKSENFNCRVDYKLKNTSWINEEKGSGISKRKVYEKLVFPTIPPEIELYSYSNVLFCFG